MFHSLINEPVPGTGIRFLGIDHQSRVLQARRLGAIQMGLEAVWLDAKPGDQYILRMSGLHQEIVDIDCKPNMGDVLYGSHTMVELDKGFLMLLDVLDNINKGYRDPREKAAADEK